MAKRKKRKPFLSFLFARRNHSFFCGICFVAFSIAFAMFIFSISQSPLKINELSEQSSVESINTDSATEQTDSQDEVATVTSNSIANNRIIERTIEVILRTILLYVAIFVIIIIFRYIFESMKESFFTDMIGIVAAVFLSAELLSGIIGYFTETFYAHQRIWLWLSVLLFAFTTYLIIGNYPMSTRILIKAIQRKLKYTESIQSDWIKEGDDSIPIEVVQINTIPQKTENIRGINELNINKAINGFLKGKRSLHRFDTLILVGGFGSGKSTALLNNVQSKIGKKLFHSGEVPLYIKLREWLTDDMIVKIRENYRQVITADEYYEYMNLLCKHITQKSEHDADEEELHKILLTLHEERRIIYVFDGLNEILQRESINKGDDDKENEQMARNVTSFLYRFSNGNRCIISMCELPKVITSTSILQNNENDHYLIYAVKGVELNKYDTRNLKKAENQWKKKLISSVALYRLACNFDSSSNALSNPEQQKECYENKTVFALLENYVHQQVNSDLIDEKKREECEDVLDKLVSSNLEAKEVCLINLSDYLHTPYSGLTDKELFEKEYKNNSKKKEEAQELLTYLVNTHLLYRKIENSCDHTADGTMHEPAPSEATSISSPKEQYYRYHTSHILIYEYLLAKYMFTSLGNKMNEAKFRNYFVGNPDEENPDLFELPHIKSVFIMLITKLYFSNNSNCFYYISSLAQCMETKGLLIDFLVLLSNINDIIQSIDKESVFQKNILEIKINVRNDRNEETIDVGTKIIKVLINNSEIRLPTKFALLKLLCTDNQQEKCTIKKIILQEALQKEWTYLNIQREIVEWTLNH